LAALYVRFGGMIWMRGVFYGVGAAVIAIVLRSVVKLVKLTLSKDLLLWCLFVISAVATAWTEKEIIWLFAAGGVVTLFVKAPPKRFSRSRIAGLAPVWFLTGIHGAASPSVLVTIAGYFAAAGAFVFGSGLAIVPFLHGGVVTQFHWLNDQQFLDAVAVAMITPGPVVITVAFIGYLVAGPAGAVVAALGTFVPCYLFTVVPAPYFRRFAKNPQIAAFVVGVTAAATGAIAGAAFVLGRRALFDTPTVLICLVTLFVVTKFKKVQEPLLIVASGLLGLILFSIKH
jgi:chromate transporter